MRYCEKCRVSVRDSREDCPLCQGPLSGEPEPCVFPELPDERPPYHLLIRGMVFLSIAAVVVCFAVNTLVPSSSWWALFVAAGIACMWVCLWSVIRQRNNIPKNILWLVFWLSLLAVLWDVFTGWHRWSLNYVVPSLCVFAMAGMAVIARVLHLRVEDFFIYLIIDGLFGVVPILFLLFRWVTVVYPSVVCVACSLLSLAAILSFEGERMRAEWKKRMHL
ncbi:DUF6320 domain-containing protein [uncultured Anaerotruncus sp.]|uniref:DUF6320 domain-containing protein n=1 Tax=uncultured Anaerotruncus sp. TaxID=905011 RepID=UPI00280AB070|nr:DUF6320 domain-containing protein [uncultured Anaerotruncus sp.]